MSGHTARVAELRDQAPSLLVKREAQMPHFDGSVYAHVAPGRYQAAATRVIGPRGGVLFGDPNQILGDIARGHNLIAWVDPTTGINIVDLGKLASGGALAPNHDAYAPPIPPGSSDTAKTGTDYCIIGTPQQTWEGVDFEVLLDPSLKIHYPPDVVKLDMSSTTIDLLPLSKPFGNDSQGFIPPPTASGNYIVAGVRHYGDSRGNPWYSEICGVTQNGLLLAMGKPQ